MLCFQCGSQAWKVTCAFCNWHVFVEPHRVEHWASGQEVSNQHWNCAVVCSWQVVIWWQGGLTRGISSLECGPAMLTATDTDATPRVHGFGRNASLWLHLGWVCMVACVGAATVPRDRRWTC